MEYTKLILQNSDGYWCTEFSSKNMVNIAFFLSTEVGCPPTNWEDWILDDEESSETSGNRMVLEKEDNYVYLSDHYESKRKKTRFKLSHDCLIKLLYDWKEKVCKKMPQEVTITYKDDIFTLTTSDDIPDNKKSILKNIFSIIVSLSVLITAILWHITPIFKSFPEPNGPYTVGTTTIELKDISRQDPYTKNIPNTRNLMIRFFYPAQSSPEKYVYLSDKLPRLIPLIAQQFSCPESLTKKMIANIPTHTYENAPLAKTKNQYPIILFSHGLLGLPSDMHHALLENIASNGYIVAAIDHPYFNLLTTYPNRTSISSQALTTQFHRMSPHEQKKFQSNAIDTYKADMRHVINQLTQLNQDQNNIFYHHLDLNSIGIIGHSAGGTAAIELSRIDHRIKVCINLDGWYDHIIGYEPIKQPLLLLFGSQTVDIKEPNTEYLKRKEISREQYYQKEMAIAAHRKALCKTSHCNMIIIPNISHEDFSDKVLLKWPLRAWNEPNSYWVIRTISSRILNFLSDHLRS